MPPLERPPSTVSRYRLGERLSDEKAELYEAEDREGPARVVIELLPSSLEADQKDLILSRAHQIAALEDAAVATLREAGETDDARPFLCWKERQGESLEDRLRRDPLALNQAVWLAELITRGLHHLHAAEIPHRSLRPGNVEITPGGEIRLFDFGLRRMVQEAAEQPAALEEVSYQAPEQLDGETGDLRSDIWSLGIVLYQMITGSLPFVGDSAQAMARSVLEDHPRSMGIMDSYLPTELERLMARTLARDPSQRYPAASDLLVDLLALRKLLHPSPVPKPADEPEDEPEEEELDSAPSPPLTATEAREEPSARRTEPRMIDLFLFPSLVLLLMLALAWFRVCRTSPPPGGSEGPRSAASGAVGISASEDRISSVALRR